MAQLPSSVQLNAASLPGLRTGCRGGSWKVVTGERGQRRGALGGEGGSEARRGRERASVTGELERGGGGGFREWPVSKC